MDVAQAGLSLHLSKYHIVGNHMSRLYMCKTAETSVCCASLFVADDILSRVRAR